MTEPLETHRPRRPRGSRFRHLSPRAAAATLVAVVVVAGGVGYLGFDHAAGGGSTVTRCGSSRGGVDCALPTSLNDVVLFPALHAALGETMVSLATGQPIPVNVSLGNDESASNFTVVWGDGSSTTRAGSEFSHAYNGSGTYVLSATASVGGVTHTGTRYLFPVTVLAPTPAGSRGQFPTLTTTFSNGSATGPNYPWVHAGGAVTVTASYSALPSEAGYTAGVPTIRSSGGDEVSLTNTSTSVTATFSFGTAGQYQLTMVGPVTGPDGRPTGTTLGRCTSEHRERCGESSCRSSSGTWSRTGIFQVTR